MNTITKTAILESAKLADLYAAELRGIGWTPNRSLAAGPEKVLRAEFQNGELYQRNLPFGRMAKWVRLFPGNETFLITFGRLDDSSRVTLRTIDGKSEISFANRAEQPGALDVPPLRFDDDNHAREDFRLVAPADMTALAASVKSAKQSKELARLREREIAAKRALKIAAADACFKMSVCGAQFIQGGIVFALPVFDAAVADVKRTRNARRQLRRALANLDTCPDWMPATRPVERRATVDVIGADGRRVVKELWRDDWAKRVAEYEYASTPLPYDRFNYFFETEDRTWVEHLDCRAEFAGHLATIHAARAALANYKPRKLEAKPVYASHRRRWVKPMLKQDKLAEAVKQAEDRLRYFIQSRFNDYCEANVICASQYRGGYSLARRDVRRWTARKAPLAAAYVEALNARRKAQAA